MSKTFQCDVVTPDRRLFSKPATYASIPSWDGQLGVLAGRSRMLIKLGTGPLRIDLADGTQQWFLVDGGFAQISSDTVNLLTETATPAPELEKEEADRELAAANARVGASGESTDEIEHDQARAYAARQVIRVAGS